MRINWLGTAVVVLLVGAAAGPALALDKAHYDKAKATIAKGLAYLKSTQDPSGAWTPRPGPAVTAMVATVLLDQPGVDLKSPELAKALAYIQSKVHPNGGIYSDDTPGLENYNTSICLSALARISSEPGIGPIIQHAQDYLRHLQWSDQVDPAGHKVDKNHPFYGGAGYGRSGRPDLSNTQMMIQGLHDSGLDCNDPAFQRALVFITRCQGTPANKMLGDKIVPDGGFIYSTSAGKDKIGVPTSPAGTVTMEDGTTRLATYGSMTYAGFKSYLYAKLNRNDPRVQAALGWIEHHYTLDRNPGLGPKDQGLYYYYLTFARALHAWGEPTITTADGVKHDWRVELIDKLASLQRPDGSWVNNADRWMEGDPNLVTAYALLALDETVN